LFSRAVQLRMQRQFSKHRSQSVFERKHNGVFLGGDGFSRLEIVVVFGLVRDEEIVNPPIELRAEIKPDGIERKMRFGAKFGGVLSRSSIHKNPGGHRRLTEHSLEVSPLDHDMHPFIFYEKMLAVTAHARLISRRIDAAGGKIKTIGRVPVRLLSACRTII